MASEPSPDTSKRNSPEMNLLAWDDCRMVLEDAAARVEIDLPGRVIRKTWKVMGLVHSRTYELDAHADVQIRDRSTTVEGYFMASFALYLSNKGKNIRIASTDDPNDARLMQIRIAEFLKGASRRPTTNNSVQAALLYPEGDFRRSPAE